MASASILPVRSNSAAFLRHSAMNCSLPVLRAPEPAPAAVQEITREGYLAASIRAV